MFLQALNTDLTDTKQEIKNQISELTQQVETLQRDIGRLVDAMGAMPDRIESRTPYQQSTSAVTGASARMGSMRGVGAAAGTQAALDAATGGDAEESDGY
ncbi:hypothetical protein Vafri_10331 [Volvox africanus]|uniref:Uncharacterized protein n=1 Tax=Volvox africanus TaxID=51714 RepID=A0A8J4B6Y4_9CHLO|nr:hypothetical protein Vafri_10331 [Volvox africanus]